LKKSGGEAHHPRAVRLSYRGKETPVVQRRTMRSFWGERHLSRTELHKLETTGMFFKTNNSIDVSDRMRASPDRYNNQHIISSTCRAIS